MIICGGRDFVGDEVHSDWLRDLVTNFKVTEIVSGGARGADRFGEQLAKRLKLKLTLFPANWTLYGPRAGPIRNQEMADYADACAALPGGRGTADMIRRAKKNNLQLFLYGTP